MKNLPTKQLKALAKQANAAFDASNEAFNQSVDQILQCGKALREAKALVKHGEWLVWLERNCPSITDRTAQKYMKAADKYESGSFLADAKTVTELYLAAGIVKPKDPPVIDVEEVAPKPHNGVADAYVSNGTPKPTQAPPPESARNYADAYTSAPRTAQAAPQHDYASAIGLPPARASESFPPLQPAKPLPVLRPEPPLPAAKPVLTPKSTAHEFDPERDLLTRIEAADQALLDLITEAELMGIDWGRIVAASDRSRQFHQCRGHL